MIKRVLGWCALMVPVILSAHHSYAPFDRDKEVTLKGTVRTWEMGNPHAYLWIYVTNRKGGHDVWGMEAPSPGMLVRYGWNKYTVKVGDAVTVVINPLRDGRTGGLLLTMRLADGKEMDTRPRDGYRAPPERQR
jgi:hypothetical protein